MEHKEPICTGDWSFVPDEERQGAGVALCYHCGASTQLDQDTLNRALEDNHTSYLLRTLTEEGVWVKLFGALPEAP